MSTAPSVLLLDDGELDRVAAVFRRLGHDFVHLRGSQIGVATLMPRDLLITSLERAIDPPEFESLDAVPPEPVRICVHSQDLLPVQERLRSLGTHFLVRSTTDPESLRLLFLQLLHQGTERRGGRRVPLSCEVEYRLDGQETGDERIDRARLAEICLDGCRLISTDPIPTDRAIRLVLPEGLAEDGPVELHGVTLRCTPCESPPGCSGFAVALQFRGLDAKARAGLDRILRGSRRRTEVTPLEPIPAGGDSTSPSLAPPDDAEDDATCPSPRPRLDAEDDDSSPSAALLEDEQDEPPTPVIERRRHRRRRYQRRVPALRSLEDEEPMVVMTRDLSSMGARISPCEGLGIGSRIALAIHAGDRQEPLILEARVLHDTGEEGVGVEFVAKTASQTKQLEQILQQLPYVTTLRDHCRRPEPVFPSRVLFPEAVPPGPECRTPKDS